MLCLLVHLQLLESPLDQHYLLLEKQVLSALSRCRLLLLKALSPYVLITNGLNIALFHSSWVPPVDLAGLLRYDQNSVFICCFVLFLTF